MAPVIQELTIYQDDDETPIDIAGAVAPAVTVSNDPDSPRPWLETVLRSGESFSDFVEGRSRLGMSTVVVLDKRLDPSDQATGAITAILADAAGESAMQGRRIVLRESRDGGASFATLEDGIIGDVSLNDDLVSYTLVIRDIRERERETPLFMDSIGSTSALPAGVVHGFGYIQAWQGHGDRWLIPKAGAAIGVFESISVVSGAHKGRIAIPTVNGQLTIDGVNYLSDARVPGLQDLTKAKNVVLDGSIETKLVFYNVAVRWRPASSTDDNDWVLLRNMPAIQGADTSWNGYVFDNVTGRSLERVYIHLRSEDGDGFPSPGQSVQVQLIAMGRPTEQYPLFWEGRAGKLLKDVYDGVYTPGGRKVRYQSSAFSNDWINSTPIMRIRITEPVKDMRTWLEEHWYKPLGYAPVMNSAREIAPVKDELPTAAVSLPQLDNSNCEKASWMHGTSETRTKLIFRFKRAWLDRGMFAFPFRPLQTTELDIYRETEEAYEYFDVGAAATVGTREIIFQPETIRDIDLATIGFSEGITAVGEVDGESLSRQRWNHIRTRFRKGGQHILIEGARRSDAAIAALTAGKWVIVAHDELPDYISGERGINRLAQVVGVTNVDLSFRDIELLDAGPVGQPLEEPELGSVVVAADGERLQVTVDVVQPDTEVQIEYAISAVQPSVNGGDWKHLGRTDAAGDVFSGILPAGVTVWVRARSEAEGMRPSAWTTSVSTDMPAVAKVLWGLMNVDPVTGQIKVFWEPNPFVTSVIVRFDTIDFGDSIPVSPYSRSRFFGPNDGKNGVVLEAIDPELGEGVAAEIVCTGALGQGPAWSLGVYQSSLDENTVAGRIPVLLNWRVTQQTATTITYGWARGGQVRSVTAANALVKGSVGAGDPPISSAWDALAQQAFQSPPLPANQNTYTVLLPRAGFDRIGQVEPRGADGFPGPVKRFHIQGTPAPFDYVVTITEIPASESPSGRAYAILDLTIDDPRGVIESVRVFTQKKGVRSGPLNPTNNYGGNHFDFEINLDEKHPLGIQFRFLRQDGEPDFWTEFYIVDTDKAATITSVLVSYDEDDALILVDGDSDAVALFYQEETSPGVWSAETEIDPRAADPRFGSFTVTASPSADRKFRIYGKNSLDEIGPFKELIIPAFVLPARYIECVVSVVSTDDDSVTVEVLGRAPVGTPQVKLVSVNGNTAQLTGAAEDVLVASGSQWSFSRGPFQNGVGQVEFTAVLAGFEDDSDQIVIPEKGRDTLFLVARAAVINTTPTHLTVRVLGADPFPGPDDGADEVSVDYIDEGVPSVTPASGQVLPHVYSTLAERTDPGEENYVDFSVERPAPGAGAGRVTFLLSKTGRVEDSDSIDVPERTSASLALKAVLVTDTGTFMRYRIYVADAFPQGDDSVSIAYESFDPNGSGALNISPTSPQTFDGVTNDLATTGFVEFDVHRPAEGGLAIAVVTFRATAANRVPAAVTLIVPPVGSVFPGNLNLTCTPAGIVRAIGVATPTTESWRWLASTSAMPSDSAVNTTGTLVVANVLVITDVLGAALAHNGRCYFKAIPSQSADHNSRDGAPIAGEIDRPPDTQPGPGITLTVKEDGTVPMYIGGHSNTGSIKWLSSTSGEPSDSAVRATTAVNAAFVSSSSIATLAMGGRVWVKGFLYSEVDGGGTESPPMRAEIDRQSKESATSLFLSPGGVSINGYTGVSTPHPVATEIGADGELILNVDGHSRIIVGITTITPQGALITGCAIRHKKDTNPVSGSFSCFFIRGTDSTATVLATLALGDSAAYTTVSNNSLNEDTTNRRYTFTYDLRSVSTDGPASILWFRVDYTKPTLDIGV